MSVTPYAEWASRWETGMALSQPYQEARAVAARGTMIGNRRAAAKTRCAIKGCPHTGCRRGLCTKHYKMVPYSLKAEKSVACIVAEMREAQRWDRKFIAAVRALEPVT